MKITPHAKTSALIALALLATAWVLPGCQQRNLFADDDLATRNRLRYFNDESARETTESRRQTSQWGFGFPTGMGEQ
jgi:hypothetical protein